MKETKSLQDKQLFSQDCPLPFTWTAGEREIFHSKQLSEPKRCKPCRERRKLTIAPKAVQDG